MEEEIIRFDMEDEPIHREPMTEEEWERAKRRIYTEQESYKFNEERKKAYLAMTEEELVANWEPYPVPQWVRELRAEALKNRKEVWHMEEVLMDGKMKIVEKKS